MTKKAKKYQNIQNTRTLLDKFLSFLTIIRNLTTIKSYEIHYFNRKANRKISELTLLNLTGQSITFFI